MIFPDGTTMLFDAGNLDKEKFEEKFEEKYNPLKATSPTPNDSHSAAQLIAYYIKNAMPKGEKPVSYYGLMSHFHEDHYGSFVALGSEIPIKKIIDRNYPNYNFPLDLRAFLSKDLIFTNYFIVVR